MGRKRLFARQESPEPRQGGSERQEWALERISRPDGQPLAILVRAALDEAERAARLPELPQAVRAYDAAMPPGVLDLAQRLSFIHQAVDADTCSAAGHNRLTLFYRRQVGEHRDDHPDYHEGTWAILCSVDCADFGELRFTELGVTVRYEAGDCVIFDRTQAHCSGQVCERHLNATAYSRGREPGVFERES